MALGSMGMNLEDFDSLTPTEFDASYNHFERTRIHEKWDQVRFLATASLSPWSKKSLKATDVVRFPWDDETHHNVPYVSKEDAKAMYEQLIKHIHG